MATLSWINYLQLLACALSPAIIAIVLHYFLKKWKWFHRQNYWLQQVMIGLVFSLLTLCSFYFGVDYSSITSNGLYHGVEGNFGSANASPLIAGLVFGGPSGLIAGFCAAIYRLFIYPFGSGDYLRSAECITVLLAGGVAWLLRVTLFDNKKPKWFYGLIIGMLIETTHMLLIFAVAIVQVDSLYAYGIIRACDIPCFVTVGLSIMIALIGISILEKEKLINRVKGGDKRIATKIQKWLALTFAISLLVTFSFTYWGNYQKSAYDVSENLDNGNMDIRIRIKNDKDIKPVEWGKKESEKLDSIEAGTYTLCQYQRIGKDGFTMLLDYETRKVLSVGLSSYDDPESSDGFIGKKYDVVSKYPDSNKYYEVTLESGAVAYLKWERINLTTAGTKQVDFVAMSFMYRTEARLEMGIVVRLTSYLELLVFIGIFGVIYTFIKRVVVSNVIKINNSLDKITGGNLNTRVNVRSNKEFSDLSDDINQTVDTLKHFIEEANKRIDAELNYAKQIQQSSLPVIFPTSSNYDLYATMHTAKQVGGDFYDFFPVGRDHMFFLIADVSGKGIPAAMFMMRAKTLVKSLVETNELSLDHIISGVNDELNRDNGSGMFVTAWFGMLDINTGEIEFVNAGHCNPLIGSPGKMKYLKMKKNCVLGVIPNIDYKLEKIRLRRNQSIILYTDGVTEATSKKKKLYGEPRLLVEVNYSGAKTSKEMLEDIYKSVDKFQTGAEQADDITMLMVKYKPKK